MNRELRVGMLLLGMATAGCAILEPKPGPGPGPGPEGNTCSDPGPVPSPPPLKSLRESEPLPFGATTQIIVGYCPSTDAYIALGVDTAQKAFTFEVGGGQATRSVFFSQAYASGVPMAVYTRAVVVKPRGASGTQKEKVFDPCSKSLLPQGQENQATGASTKPAPSGKSSATASGDCAVAGTHCEIGEEPPRDPDNPNSWWNGQQVQAFQALAWSTANALDAVSDPGPETADQ